MDDRLDKAFKEITWVANEVSDAIEEAPDARERFCRLASLNDLLRTFRKEIEHGRM